MGTLWDRERRGKRGKKIEKGRKNAHQTRKGKAGGREEGTNMRNFCGNKNFPQ